MRFGRKDAEGPESVQPEGNLPGTDCHCVYLLMDAFTLHGQLAVASVNL